MQLVNIVPVPDMLRHQNKELSCQTRMRAKFSTNSMYFSLMIHFKACCMLNVGYTVCSLLTIHQVSLSQLLSYQSLPHRSMWMENVHKEGQFSSLSCRNTTPISSIVHIHTSVFSDCFVHFLVVAEICMCTGRNSFHLSSHNTPISHVNTPKDTSIIFVLCQGSNQFD